MKKKCICYFSPLDVCIGFGGECDGDFKIVGDDVRPTVDACGYYMLEHNPIGKTAKELAQFGMKND